MKIMSPPSKGPKQALLYSVPPTLQQATADPHLCERLLDTLGQVWVSLLWDHCSFLLGPGAQDSVCAHQESVSLSCVSSGSSLVGLMVTSSKRSYAIPMSTAPRAPAPAAGHCWHVPPQETPKHEQYEKAKGRTLKNELLRLVGAQYATGDQWRNNSRKNEEMEPKQKQYPAGDVTGDWSKVQCYKEKYCIGTWNVRSMNQGKLEVVKQEIARVNVDILGISKLK